MAPVALFDMMAGAAIGFTLPGSPPRSFRFCLAVRAGLQMPCVHEGFAMIYHVTARLRPKMATAFLQKLSDGTIAAQRPDGAEIVASMKRAVVRDDGSVEWSEMCFCNPPLAHERSSVLDTYFVDMRTEPIHAHRQYNGRPFLDYLRELAA